MDRPRLTQRGLRPPLSQVGADHGVFPASFLSRVPVAHPIERDHIETAVACRLNAGAEGRVEAVLVHKDHDGGLRRVPAIFAALKRHREGAIVIERKVRMLPGLLPHGIMRDQHLAPARAQLLGDCLVNVTDDAVVYPSLLEEAGKVRKVHDESEE